MIDHTHNPSAGSWVSSAQDTDTEFPIQNLPFGVFRCSAGGQAHIGIAIGREILDLHAARKCGLLRALTASAGDALLAPDLNALFALGRPALRSIRHEVFNLLVTDSAQRQSVEPCLTTLASAHLLLPCDIGDYSDFFASHNHARNTFNLFRPGQVFLPNFAYVPIAYHGRASSVVASGTPFHRPWGQFRPDPAQEPLFGPCRKLDFEVEMAAWVGPGNGLGKRIGMNEAEDHLMGLSILNDWSARDVQAWESQPLGPFLAKSFASSVSPWVVTLEALAPFRAPMAQRPAEMPAILPYLDGASNRARGTFGIDIETTLQSSLMRERGMKPVRVTQARFDRDIVWSPAQMVVHHSVNGCNLRPGDMLGSGTISGPEAGTEGSLLEITWNGERPIALPDGTERNFLHDGDEVRISARCERAGFRTIGFGDCVGRVLPQQE